MMPSSRMIMNYWAFISLLSIKYILGGREFSIFTHHKPLIFAFKQKSGKASQRQFRQLKYISQFRTDIQHICENDKTL